MPRGHGVPSPDLTPSSGRGRRFEWRIDEHNCTLSITLRGEIDLAAVAEMNTELERAMSGANPIVTVDLSPVTFIDSTGLRLLIRIKQHVEARGARLLLGPLSKPVRRLLDVTRMHAHFEYVGGEGEPGAAL